MAENVELKRDYVDTYSVKDLMVNGVIPKYFPDEDPTYLTTGTIGAMSEFLATVTEDAFNTGSFLLSEVFPTRSKMANSIYANAAIFQLSNMFGTAGYCDFLVILAESDVRRNLKQKYGTEYCYFYIDKDTVFRVGDENETIPFTLDYDIEIRAVYRQSSGKWIYSAKYMVEEYTNSISKITDPYIRLTQQPNGMIVMKVQMRQYTRSVRYEPIVDNATLNYPTVVVGFDGTLAGFDILYREPDSTEFNKQLKTQVIYTNPLKEPFCYYRMLTDNSFEISFTTKDAYFQPKFNSELQIILYTTKGKAGEFPFYDGEVFSITKGEKYIYNNSWLIASRSMTGCTGGKDRMSLEGLRDLTIEGFTTALSLNTENDLQTYFNNYKHRYDNEMLFVKKRNDAVELLFSAFMFIKNGDYIYPTNTLYLDTNIKYLDYKDGGFYNLDPGYLFSYKNSEAFFIKYYFVINGGEGEKYDPDGKYYDKDMNRVPGNDITKHELTKKILGGFVTETDHSYWKLPEGGELYYYMYTSDGALVEEAGQITPEDMYTRFNEGEFTFGYVDSGEKVVDFCFDIEKEAECKKEYLAYYDQYKVDKEKPDLTFEEYIFEYSYKDFKEERHFDNRRTIFNTDVETYAKGKDFLFVNPFITTITKDTGLVSYYQSFIDDNLALDYVAEHSGETFEQFITYTLNVVRDVTDEKKYTFTVATVPSVTSDEYMDFIQVMYNEDDPSQFIHKDGEDPKPSLSTFDKSLLDQNALRMILTFSYKDLEVGYLELIPVSYYKPLDQIVFKGEIHTDDFISAANTIRITHICPYCGHEILNSKNGEEDERMYFCDNCREMFYEGIINTREMDTLELPVQDGLVKLTSLFRSPDHPGVTDNEFVQFNSTYEGYIWTNIYETMNDRVSLMEPLEMMRSSIVYKDYYENGVDAFDCEISDLPLLKYSIMAYDKEGPKIDDPLLTDDIGKFSYFMTAFLDNYDVLKEAKIYLNGIHIDTKFYNSYGRSTNFDIGEDGRPIDTNNIRIYMDVYVLVGTDTITANSELGSYIKNYIETINDERGSNNLYISNLQRAIENDFAYVHHTRFRGINGYSSDYQAVINRKIGLENMTKQQRRRFVPDILVVNRHNVYLSFYTYDLE